MIHTEAKYVFKYVERVVRTLFRSPGCSLKISNAAPYIILFTSLHVLEMLRELQYGTYPF